MYVKVTLLKSLMVVSLVEFDFIYFCCCIFSIGSKFNKSILLKKKSRIKLFILRNSYTYIYI